MLKEFRTAVLGCNPPCLSTTAGEESPVQQKASGRGMSDANAISVADVEVDILLQWLCIISSSENALLSITDMINMYCPPQLTFYCTCILCYISKVYGHFVLSSVLPFCRF